MKNLICIVSLLFVFICQIFAQNQTKEVYIIGTMHQVPKYLKNAYKPLYKKALKYNPEAIYVERARSTDSISLKNDYHRFLQVSDSLKNVFEIDFERFNRLSVTNLGDMTVQDYKYMRKCFIVKKDYANYEYFHYLRKYGLNHPVVSTRDEGGEISHRLAAQLNLKYIHSMDDQTERKEYHTAWRACANLGAKNGDQKVLKRMIWADYLGAIIPSLFRQYGMRTNKWKNLKRGHQINSFEYTKNGEPVCSVGNEIWDNRNRRMVKNIAEQVLAQDHSKNLVVVGAGHVYGMVEEFQRTYPQIKIKLLRGEKGLKEFKSSEEKSVASN